MCNLTISQVGMLLNLSGTILLFFFGLPSGIINETDDVLSTGRKPDKEILSNDAKNKLIKSLSYLGLLLIIAGFLLQFIDSTK